MYQNYIKLAFRSLRRNMKHIFINVFGLGAAIAFAILSFFIYQFAHSYDDWHTDAHRIVRVESWKNNQGEASGFCPSALAALAEEQLTDVVLATTFDLDGTVVKQGDYVFNDNIAFVDNNFREVFDFPILSGSNDISNPNTVLISEQQSKKYFGAENPVGKDIMLFADSEAKKTFTIGGMFETTPLNSSMRFSFVTHTANQKRNGAAVEYASWENHVRAVFLKLKSPERIAAAQRDIQRFIPAQNTANPDWSLASFHLTPLREVALRSRQLWNDALWQGTPDAAVWGNIVLAIVLLFAAMLNFANMTLSVSNTRLREMGVRKVMGSTRGQLIRQLLIESFVIVFLAAIVGLVLAFPLCDWYNDTWRFSKFMVDLGEPGLWIFLLSTVVCTTLLAGSYPAFYLSSFRPAHIFRGNSAIKGSTLFSRSMMGLQVCIAIFAVVTGISFAQNAEYNRTSDIGFSYQNRLQAWLPNPSDYTRFANAIQSIPEIKSTTGTVHLPGFGNRIAEIDVQGQKYNSTVYDVGVDFLEKMNFKLRKGAWPDTTPDSLASPDIVVNQRFIRQYLNGAAALGQSITIQDQRYQIRGIVEDFMTSNPFSPQQAALIRTVPQYRFQRLIIETNAPSDAKKALAAMEAKWKDVFPFTPFNVGYQDEMLQEAIEVSSNIAKAMHGFSLVTILLCIAGLFSLISLDVLKRARELAIRRVLGASPKHITWILNKNFLGIFGIAIVLGCLFGRYFSTLLMDNIFKHNSGVQGQTLVIATVSVVAILICTIGIKIWQTMRVNPADTLRGE